MLLFKDDISLLVPDRLLWRLSSCATNLQAISSLDIDMLAISKMLEIRLLLIKDCVRTGGGEFSAEMRKYFAIYRTFKTHLKHG